MTAVILFSTMFLCSVGFAGHHTKKKEWGRAFVAYYCVLVHAILTVLALGHL